jgi:choline dehydrogenase-like flavoprotein
MNEFDYVIVGAGSAGCVLAARLTEDPGVTVALVEAGGPDTAQEVHIPVAFGALFKGALDWDLDSEPEPGLGGRRCYLPRGKVFGGSSSMNAMIYMRGNRVDYDGWAAAGAAGWGYDDVLPYFRRSEDNQRGANAFHGAGGPLTVSDSRSSHPLAAAFVDAAQAAGHKHNDDFNAGSQEGVGFYQLTQRNGLRCSAAVAFLHPALERPNLTVHPFSRALNVVVEGGRAVGVRVRRTGQADTVLRARGEVILAAGVYESPKLLMLSGIGPAGVLPLFGIDVLVDLPVGQGLRDHLMTMINYRTGVESLMTALTPTNSALLQAEGRGPMTSNVGEAGGFLHSRDDLPAPDVQLHMAPVLFYDQGLGSVVTHGLAIGPAVVAPTSSGYLTLRTADPESAPRILHNYLASAEDRTAIVAGVRAVLDIARQRPLAGLITGPFDVPDGDSDADLLRFVRRASMTLFHPTSTCAIGSVVDPQLRVLGVDGLRVVDASVMPGVPRGNTNAPTIMIAERAADLIRGPLSSAAI